MRPDIGSQPKLRLNTNTNNIANQNTGKLYIIALLPSTA